ncbi:MAG: hypothetical protein HW378_186 [Anaerolineales bacterium]|nr:hypothetical protein [Anaerolineales bacterium]
MASQVYYAGDFYDCIVATAPGESPATHPAKWARVEIPRLFERALVQGAFAETLLREGQMDKRRGEEALFKDDLDEITADQMIHEADWERPVVLTR